MRFIFATSFFYIVTSYAATLRRHFCNFAECIANNQTKITMKRKLLSIFALLLTVCTSVCAGATDGMLTGRFTVNAQGKQVAFSQGNLQAVFASAGSSCTWRFATNQWDYVGNAAGNTSIDSAGSVSAAAPCRQRAP